jgi:hypothetical protein
MAQDKRQILQYLVKTSSTVEELTVLCRLLAEMGGYASTVLDREHAALSRRCAALQAKAEEELLRRGAIADSDEIYRVPDEDIDATDLSELSVAQLETQYRRRGVRIDRRLGEGREPFTYYYEGRIVRELLTRKALDTAEQFKIDYCAITYGNDLENMSRVLSLPMSGKGDRLEYDPYRSYTPAELLALIKLYSGYRDIEERELLIEYVDVALDSIREAEDKASVLALATEIAELGKKKKVSCPRWVTDVIEEGLESAQDCDKVLPMLTQSAIRNDESLERKAQRIVNRCYKSCLTAPTVDMLYVAVLCSDYVNRYSVRKMASVWTHLCESVLDSETDVPTSQLVMLLETSEEIAPYADLSDELSTRLTQTLETRARHGDLEAASTLRRLTSKELRSNDVI